MGLFGQLFTKKKSPSLEGNKNGSFNDLSTSLSERTWEYEGGAVKNGVHVLGDRYFQDQIKAHNAHTIDARLVDWKGVKCCAVEWYSKDDLSQIYIVDSKGTMLGYIYSKYLPNTGYKLGDKVKVAVSEKYTNDSLSLFVLKNDEGIEYCEQQRNVQIAKLTEAPASRQ